MWKLIRLKFPPMLLRDRWSLKISSCSFFAPCLHVHVVFHVVFWSGTCWQAQRNRYHFESSICPRGTATARRTWDTSLPKMFLRSSCRSPLGRTVCQRLQQRQQQKEELHQLSRALTTATGPRKHVSKVMLEEFAVLRSFWHVDVTSWVSMWR